MEEVRDEVNLFSMRLGLVAPTSRQTYAVQPSTGPLPWDWIKMEEKPNTSCRSTFSICANIQTAARPPYSPARYCLPWDWQTNSKAHNAPGPSIFKRSSKRRQSANVVVHPRRWQSTNVVVHPRGQQSANVVVHICTQ